MKHIDPVPRLDLQAQYQAIKAEVDEAISRVVASQRFILGPEVAQLEQNLQEYLHVKHAVGVSNGSDALVLSLMVLGIGPGDEVIVPAYSFIATASSVSLVGATPVFVDIEPRSFQLNPALLTQAITGRTRAIIPVHLFGQAADMVAIMGFAREHRLEVIEDAAQSIGVRVGGQYAGSIGSLGCFSFFPSKNLGAYGDAGLIVTNDGALAESLRSLRVHGSKPKYFHAMIGMNARMASLQAAVLNVKLGYLNQWNKMRREKANNYRDLLQGVRPDLLMLPEETLAPHHIYNQFVIRSPKRDQLKQALTDNRVGCEIYYPFSLPRQECFKSLGLHVPGDFPVAEECSQTALGLPIFPELSLEQQQHVATVIKRVLGYGDDL